MRRRGKPWHVGRRWQDAQARSSIERLGIRTRSPHMLVKELSGGNQQKVLFAKWLSVEPDLLVLHEPTQAVDVGARADLLRAIVETAGRGVGVLLVSMEPSDLAEVCDRILVLRPWTAAARDPHRRPRRGPRRHLLRVRDDRRSTDP